MKGNLTNLVTTFLSAPLPKLSPHKLLLQAWNSIVLYFVFLVHFHPVLCILEFHLSISWNLIIQQGQTFAVRSLTPTSS